MKTVPHVFNLSPI